MKELISIIIPLYNAAKFIAETLDSLYAQTYNKFQILVVDDGSTDESIEICKNYAQEKGKLEIFRQENRGPASARNVAIEHAAGEFLYFIDADDFVAKNALEVLINVYKETTADWILTEYYDIFDEGRTTPCNFWSNGECIKESDDFYQISQQQFIERIINNHQKRTGINCWGNLYRTDIIRNKHIRFDNNSRRSEDFVFCLKYIAHIETIAIPKEMCFYYRQHTAHISTKEVILPFENYIEDIRHIESPLRYVLTLSPSIEDKIVERTISGYLLNLVFPWVVKQCRKIDKTNYKKTYLEFSKLAHDPFVQKALKSYTPAQHQSKLLPFLLKVKAVRLLIIVGGKIAQYRYSNIK